MKNKNARVVRTYVNEEKRTVVVVISNTENEVIRRVHKIFKPFRETVQFWGDRSFLNGPFRGVAKCHPNDEWNEELGIEIARNRAFNQYLRARNREIMYVREVLERIDGRLEEEIDYRYINWTYEDTNEQNSYYAERIVTADEVNVEEN